MVDGYLGTMTTEERMLLHLFDNPLPEGQWEAPFAVTQAGISAAVHVQRKHVPRTLKRLEKRDELNSGQRHVPGAKQRRRVYGLTVKGKERASSIRDSVLSKAVLKDGEKVLLSSLRKGGQMTLDLLSHVDEGLVFHTNPVISPVSNPEGAASLDAQAGENLVKRMFARAWEDGKITKDEQSLLSEVVEFLGMHPERVRRLSNEARKSLKIPPPEEVYYDMILQALDDGEIVQEEIDLLNTFRIHFGIDQFTHNSLLEKARNSPVVSEQYHTYAAAVRTAMQDQIITVDEHAILRTLRGTLGISEAEHEQIMNDLKNTEQR